MTPSDSRFGGSGGDEGLDPDGERLDPTVEWRERVEDLLYEGESVEGSVAFENGSAAVVTTKRLLAFEPDLDGPNVERIDRANVEGVDTGVLSDRGFLWRALQWGFVGAVCLGGGVAIGLDSTLAGLDLPAAGAGGMGLDGLTGALGTILDLLALLDDALLVFGVLFAAYAAVLVARYARDRERTLVVEVAGSEDLHLSRPAEGTDAMNRLEALLGIRPGEVAAGAGGPQGGLEGASADADATTDDA